MALKRFKTDRKIWFRISLVLFLVPWFIPMTGKHSEMPPGLFWIFLFTHPHKFGEILSFLAIFCVAFAVPAFSVGWVLQSLFVMIRDSRTKKIERERMPGREG